MDAEVGARVRHRVPGPKAAGRTASRGESGCSRCWHQGGGRHVRLNSSNYENKLRSDDPTSRSTFRCFCSSRPQATLSTGCLLRCAAGPLAPPSGTAALGSPQKARPASGRTVLGAFGGMAQSLLTGGLLYSRSDAVTVIQNTQTLPESATWRTPCSGPSGTRGDSRAPRRDPTCPGIRCSPHTSVSTSPWNGVPWIKLREAAAQRNPRQSDTQPGVCPTDTVKSPPV